jgi:hypothetical protein
MWTPEQSGPLIDAILGQMSKHEVEDMTTREYHDEVLYGVIEAYDQWAPTAGEPSYDQLDQASKRTLFDIGLNATRYGGYKGNIFGAVGRFIRPPTRHEIPPLPEGSPARFAALLDDRNAS